MICKTRKGVCRDGCTNCYDRSLAKFLVGRSDITFVPKSATDCAKKISVGSAKSIQMKCTKSLESDHIFDTTAHTLSKGSGCPFPCCNRSPKLCSNIACKICFKVSLLCELEEKGLEIEDMATARMISRNSSKKQTFICRKSSHLGVPHTWDTIPNSLGGCPYYGCQTNFPLLCGQQDCIACYDHSLFKVLLEKNITVEKVEQTRRIAKYSKKRIIFSCNNQCHQGYVHKWETTVSKLSSCPFPGCTTAPNQLCTLADCPSCHHKRLITALKNRNDILWISGDKNRLKIFRGSTEILDWQCTANQSHIWSSSAHNTIGNSYGCPNCRNKTEGLVYQAIRELFTCSRQVTLPGCRSQRSLRFDIGINSLALLIEVDGMHHFKDISYWNSQCNDIQTRDCWKMRYALDAGYSIIRICCESLRLGRIKFDLDILPLLKKSEKPTITYIASSRNTYDSHKKQMTNDVEKFTKVLLN